MKFVFIAFYMFFSGISQAAEIPRAALIHKTELIRVSRQVWGMNAPIAVFAAQIHTESRWQEDAVSFAGAQGLAQFMPATAKWLPEVHPETGEPLPFNPAWALRALVTYDLYLWRKIKAQDEFNRMAFSLSAYNGGLGWVNKDKALAKTSLLNPLVWFLHVADVNAGRRPSTFKENRNYVRLILQERQQSYEQAGFGRGIYDY